jgi:ribosomal protein S1
MPKGDSSGESFADLFEKSQAVVRRPTARVGEEIDVVVAQIGRDAVFVELDDKQQGFIEAEDLKNVEGVIAVKVGSLVRARVEKVDGTTVQLVPVAIRQLDTASDEEVPEAAPQPVQAGGVTLMVGQHVQGKVALVERFGVFLQLDVPMPPGSKRGVRGLIPTADLALPRGADAHRHYPVGKELEAKVVAIDERGRIRLSIAELAADEERKAYEVFESQSKKDAGVAPVRLATLGDLIAKHGALPKPPSGGKGGVIRRKR